MIGLIYMVVATGVFLGLLMLLIQGVGALGDWIKRKGIITRVPSGPAPERPVAPGSVRINIARADADLLLSFCEPGSTLANPSITETNYRRFVVAQAEVERREREMLRARQP